MALVPGVRFRLVTSLAMPDGADRDGDPGSSIGRCQHVATAVEYTARINYHAGGMNFAGYDAFGLNFDAAFRENDSIEAAGYDDPIAFDLAFDFRALAED